MRLGHGQITDDSEMALALMRGLIQSDKGTVDQFKIAKEYIRWYNSDPFDMGGTTSNALNRINDAVENPADDNLAKQIAEVDKINCSSQSNGCLMRATPLSVYCSRQTTETIYEWTKKDIELTHSHKVALYSVV